MSKEIGIKVIETENNKSAFISILNSRDDVREEFLSKKVIPRIDKVIKIINANRAQKQLDELLINFDTDAFVKNNKEGKRFAIFSGLMKQNNLEIILKFDQSGLNYYESFVMVLMFINSQEKTEQQKVYASNIKRRIEMPENEEKLEVATNTSAIVKVPIKDYSNWNNWNTLFSLDSDEFELELVKKIQILLEVSEQVLES